MPVLSDQQLTQLAYDAGFRGEALRWAVAIAKAESGGNPSAYNPELAAGTTPGSGSRGLWQIYGTAHPQYNSSIAFDPVVNARAAYQVYREAGNRFTPWSTFTNGSAAQYYNGMKIKTPTKTSGAKPSTQAGKLGTASGGAAGTSSSSAADQGIGSQLAANTQALQDIASGKFITNLFKPIDKTSFTIYMIGIVLMIIGLIILFQKPITTLAVNTAKVAQQAGVIALV